MVNKELGDYGPAIDAWRKSMALSESGGDVAGTAKALAGLGDLYRLQGDLGRALQYQAQALQRWEQLKNVGRVGDRQLRHRPDPCAAAGPPRRGGIVQEGARARPVDYRRPATSESGQARDLGGLGGAHFVLGQFDTALSEYQREPRAPREAGRSTGVMWTLVHMGILHASQQRTEEAGKAYARALGIAESANDLNALSTVLALRGRLELDQDQVDAALASASRAIEVATSIEHFDTVSYAQVVAGRAHQKAARLPEARAAFEDAAAALAKVPTGPAADTFFDDRSTPYAVLVDLLANQGDTAEAFRWSERGRQRELADLLGGDGAIVTRGMTAEEQQAERTVERDVRTLAVKIRRERARKTPDEAKIADLQKALAVRQSDREALRQKIYAAHPALQALRAQGEAVGPDAASALGTTSAAVLSFVIGENRTWVFAVTGGPGTAPWSVQKAAAIDVKSSDLAQQVRRFREAIATKDEKAPDLARELHALLVEPVGAVVGKKTRIVVVPDGCLWSLPFEALQGEGGRFLVEEHGYQLRAVADGTGGDRVGEARPGITTNAGRLRPARDRAGRRGTPGGRAVDAGGCGHTCSAVARGPGCRRAVRARAEPALRRRQGAGRSSWPRACRWAPSSISACRRCWPTRRLSTRSWRSRTRARPTPAPASSNSRR